MHSSVIRASLLEREREKQRARREEKATFLATRLVNTSRINFLKVLPRFIFFPHERKDSRSTRERSTRVMAANVVVDSSKIAVGNNDAGGGGGGGSSSSDDEDGGGGGEGGKR